MNDELFTHYFIADLESINLLIRNHDLTANFDVLDNPLNIKLKLDEVQLRAQIRDSNAFLTDAKFKTFLNGLLRELFASTKFYKSTIDSENLEDVHSSVTYILLSFNNKFLSYLSNYYGKIYPDLFIDAPNFKESIDKFVANPKLEKTETFKISFLIASGKLFYDEYNFFYEDEIFTSANNLSKRIGINRSYLSDTKSDNRTPNNKNIFSPNRKPTQKHLIDKMSNEGMELSSFYLEKYDKIGM